MNVQTNKVFTEDGIFLVTRFARCDDEQVVGVNFISQAFNLRPHLSAVGLADHFIQSIQHHQAAASQKQAVKKFLGKRLIRHTNCLAVFLEIPQHKACNGPRAHVLQRGGWRFLAQA